jgi:hypothetical protein
MIKGHWSVAGVLVCLALAHVMSGCQPMEPAEEPVVPTEKKAAQPSAGPSRPEEKAAQPSAGPSHTQEKAVQLPAGPHDKPGFVTTVEDGRLWVLKPGQEKHEKHITLIGAGPGGMTIKALDKNTALEYVAARPGFRVAVEDGRLWVLKPDQEPSEKHITLIGAGPGGMTIKALDKDTALEYIAAKPPFDKPGFVTAVEDGRLWVLKPGQEKHEKHITLIGAGPGGMTIKALDKNTALEYVATKPGFRVAVEDGRLWVLKPDQEPHEKHITLIGAGPGGMTIKALDKDTALEYVAAKPGFSVHVEDGRLWVLKPGQEKGEKHVTLIGAGPRGMTIKALSKDTALEYVATKPGFEVTIEDGRLWVLKPGQEKHEKHVTRIGAGPNGMTVKAVDRDTLDAYLAALQRP